MTSPYTALTPVEQNAHITMASTVGYSGIYPSGTAHFFDPQQSVLDNPTATNSSNVSIFEFTNLNSTFSNATESYIIDDFTVFNLYRHNTSNYIVNSSSMLNVGTESFNIYSTLFRTWNLNNATS